MHSVHVDVFIFNVPNGIFMKFMLFLTFLCFLFCILFLRSILLAVFLLDNIPLYVYAYATYHLHIPLVIWTCKLNSTILT